MTLRTKTMALGMIAALGLALPAQAATVDATSVDAYTQGIGVSAVRGVTSKALGAADGKFLSLGLGGSATFSFGGLFKPVGAVVEVTYGNIARHKESVDVFGILKGITTYLGSIKNSDTGAFSFAGTFSQLKLVDTSPKKGGSTDGFDIDALSVTLVPVPVPAGGVLLLTALAAFGALRRRKA